MNPTRIHVALYVTVMIKTSWKCSILIHLIIKSSLFSKCNFASPLPPTLSPPLQSLLQIPPTRETHNVKKTHTMHISILSSNKKKLKTTPPSSSPFSLQRFFSSPFTHPPPTCLRRTNKKRKTPAKTHKVGQSRFADTYEERERERERKKETEKKMRHQLQIGGSRTQVETRIDPAEMKRGQDREDERERKSPSPTCISPIHNPPKNAKQLRAATFTS